MVEIPLTCLGAGSVYTSMSRVHASSELAISEHSNLTLNGLNETSEHDHHVSVQQEYIRLQQSADAHDTIDARLDRTWRDRTLNPPPAPATRAATPTRPSPLPTAHSSTTPPVHPIPTPPPHLPTDPPSTTTQPIVHNQSGGLTNVGLTCYLNTVLQALRHTPGILAFFQEHPPSTCSRHGDSCMLCALRNLFLNPPTTTYDTHALHQLFRQRDVNIQQHEWPPGMHDAAECLTRIVFQLRSQHDPWIQSGDTLNINIETSVYCTVCNATETIETPELYLPLHFATSCTTIHNMLSQTDDLISTVPHPCQCSLPTTWLRARFIRTPPKILILQLARFHFNRTTVITSRINTPVQFDATLQFADVPFILPRRDPTFNQARYTLYCIIQHHGTAASGHYTALVSQANGAWTLFDDEDVRPYTMDFSNPDLQKAAYVLFYRRDDSSS